MAEARQKEMKVNITVVATKTFIAGFDPSGVDVAILQMSARVLPTKINVLKIAQRSLEMVLDAEFSGYAEDWCLRFPDAWEPERYG
jgi:hypothetical protein